MKTKFAKKYFQILVFVSFHITLFSCSFVIPLSENDKQQINEKNKVYKWKPKLYSYFGIEHFVYESIHNTTEKPPIILLHQLSGLSEETLDYAQTLTTDFSVYVPLLFGKVNMNNNFYGFISYLFNSEWHPRESKPINEWVRQLSVGIEKKHSEFKMGVIGMCLTGALPLALLENKAINSIVVSQPSLPLISWSSSSKASLDLSALEYSIAKQRVLSGQVKILGLRFQQDTKAKREKLKTFKTDFSDAYIDLEICRDEYVKHDAHSVLINEWDKNKNQETINPINIRKKQVLQFFKARLLNTNKKKMLPKGKSCTDAG